MIKAKFDAKQPELAMYQEGTAVRYMIAENGREYTEEGQDGNTVSGMEYDFHEFVEDTSVLDPEKVKASPADYLQYVPTGVKTEEKTAKPSTLEQRITDLEDMVADVYGGGEA